MADPFLIELATAVIANGQSLSPQVNIGPKPLVGIVTPTNWAAAGITFQASADGGTTWGELEDATASAISIGSITGQAFITLDPAKFKGISALKLRSGTAGTPVAQNNAGGTSVRLLRRLVT
jgi:hypothetical protein